MTDCPGGLATWFGLEDASLFGVLEYPEDRRVRGGVVVVPSLGLEQVETYRGARALARQLATVGFVTLRYDHPGTGSSTGDQLSETLWDDWITGVNTAVDHLRALGVTDVTVIGIRAGCVIADAALSARAIPQVQLAFWDPPHSGRRWLRELTSGHTLAVGDDPGDPGVSVLGGHFSQATAGRMRSAKWAGAPLCLIAARPGVLADPAVTRLMDEQTAAIELTQAEFFVAPPAWVHHVPEPDIDLILDRLVDISGSDTVTINPVSRSRAVVGHRPDGSVVVEDIATVTDRHLPLFTTHVEAETALGGVVFQSTALEPAWGPSRAWVEAARENAGAGLACYRFDKTGSGEASPNRVDEFAVLYSHASRRDSLDVIGALGIPARNLLLVGLCSGAWMSAESAIRAHAGAALLFGMIQWSRVREPVTRELLESLGYDLERMLPPTTGSMRSRVKPYAQRLLPYPLWEALGRRGVTQVPGPLLRDLWDAGVRTTVGLTPEDDDHFTSQRGDAGLRKLRRRGYSGRVERLQAPLGDHSLYRSDTRGSALRLVRREADALRSRLGIPAVGGGEAPPRALFVNENIGGHATVHSALRRVLVGRPDIEVEFLDARGPGAVGKILRAPIPGLARMDVDLQPLRGQFVHSWGVTRRVRERLRRGDVDALHIYTQNCVLGGVDLLRRVPAVITTDSTGLRNAYSIPYRNPTRFTPTSSRAVLPWERPLLRAAHHVLANSVPVVESLTSSDYGLPATAVSLLRMGIWSPFLSEPLPVRPTDRRPTIVFLGTSMERKGGTLLLDVWRASLRDRADLLLVTLDPVAEEPGLRVVGDLAPGDDRLWELLAGSDIMCFPSTIDQAPNAVLEASAAGLPVIAHPGGAVPEMVLHGTTGLLVDGADPEAVTTALNTLLSDPGLRRRMGEAAAQHVRENYSIVRSADEIVAALHKAVDRAAEESLG